MGYCFSKELGMGKSDDLFIHWLHTFFKLPMFIHKETRINSYSFEFAPERYKFASQQEEDRIKKFWLCPNSNVFEEFCPLNNDLQE